LTSATGGRGSYPQGESPHHERPSPPPTKIIPPPKAEPARAGGEKSRKPPHTKKPRGPWAARGAHPPEVPPPNSPGLVFLGLLLRLRLRGALGRLLPFGGVRVLFLLAPEPLGRGTQPSADALRLRLGFRRRRFLVGLGLRVELAADELHLRDFRRVA